MVSMIKLVSCSVTTIHGTFTQEWILKYYHDSFVDTPLGVGKFWMQSFNVVTLSLAYFNFQIFFCTGNPIWKQSIPNDVKKRVLSSCYGVENLKINLNLNFYWNVEIFLKKYKYWPFINISYQRFFVFLQSYTNLTTFVLLLDISFQW